jgi:hypothetical protein
LNFEMALLYASITHQHAGPLAQVNLVGAEILPVAADFSKSLTTENEVVTRSSSRCTAYGRRDGAICAIVVSEPQASSRVIALMLQEMIQRSGSLPRDVTSAAAELEVLSEKYFGRISRTIARAEAVTVVLEDVKKEAVQVCSLGCCIIVILDSAVLIGFRFPFRRRRRSVCFSSVAKA